MPTCGPAGESTLAPDVVPECHPAVTQPRSALKPPKPGLRPRPILYISAALKLRRACGPQALMTWLGLLRSHKGPDCWLCLMPSGWRAVCMAFLWGRDSGTAKENQPALHSGGRELDSSHLLSWLCPKAPAGFPGKTWTPSPGLPPSFCAALAWPCVPRYLCSGAKGSEKGLSWARTHTCFPANIPFLSHDNQQGTFQGGKGRRHSRRWLV